MAAVLQIVDGHGGALVLELNALSSGAGGLAVKGMDLAEGQLAGLAPADAQWSPISSPTPLGRRRITLPFLLVGSSADDVGVKVAKLMEATRRPWWLKVQRHQASQPSWLQCFGGIPQVESGWVTASGVSNYARGVIVCETAPHALGARFDGSGGDVKQDPVTSAWTFDINSVPGDTATPLLLKMNDATAFNDAMGAFVSVRRRQTPANVQATKITRQANSSTNSLVNGSGITMSVQSDSGYSSGQYVRALFSSGYAAGNAASITFAAPSLSGAETPGAYRMFLRIHRVGDANNQQLVLRAFTNNSLISPESIIVPAGGALTRIVDLGVVQWPSAQPPVIAAPVPSNSGGASPTPVTLEFSRRSDGDAQVNFDFLCWIPADEDAGYLETDGPLFSPSTQFVNLDGYQHAAAITSSNPTGSHVLIGQAYGSSTPTARYTGRVPRVAPGSNRMFVVAGTNSAAEWPLSQTLHVAYSYWPRFTWLR